MSSNWQINLIFSGVLVCYIGTGKLADWKVWWVKGNTHICT